MQKVIDAPVSALSDAGPAVALPAVEHPTALRVARDALRADPPRLRFVSRDLRLPQL
jgi:hypothetical protein